MRPRLALAACAAVLVASGAAQAGDGVETTGGGDRDDAFAAAATNKPSTTVVVNAPHKVSPPGQLIVASSAPVKAFQDDEEGSRIDAFINGPLPPPGTPPPQPPRCDETPHGEVGAEIGGGSGGSSYGGYGTVVMPVAHCRGIVALSVSGSQFNGRRGRW